MWPKCASKMTIPLGDCRDLMPMIGLADAVVHRHAHRLPMLVVISDQAMSRVLAVATAYCRGLPNFRFCPFSEVPDPSVVSGQAE